MDDQLGGRTDDDLFYDESALQHFKLPKWLVLRPKASTPRSKDMGYEFKAPDLKNVPPPQPAQNGAEESEAIKATPRQSV
ncbi:nucleolar protein [Conoideocrella luteorostrata]|uniref:Nucleolar protein n=1 Tax=Conoideocrella luteorostrata TaxID=1105319 RepID=A0AAJ0FT74_9HYPO|nr:nucleolar protein [Conoideocrella luteorostrata]